MSMDNGKGKKKLVYKHRGSVERWSPSKRGYIWRDGYSEDGASGGVLYPWNTKEECRQDARSRGGVAVFHRNTRTEGGSDE